MAPAPYLIAALVELRAEFNRLTPNRDKGADGWIGDKAHQQEVSDHNPDSAGRVLAVDIDSTGPWPEAFNTYVERVRDQQRTELPRLEYIIWNKQICSRHSGWAWLPYSATDDQHTGHAHFSGRHDHVNDKLTNSYNLNGDDEVTPDDIDRITSAVWAAGFGPAGNRETSGTRLAHVDSAIDTVLDMLSDIVTTQDDIKTRLDALEGK